MIIFLLIYVLVISWEIYGLLKIDRLVYNGLSKVILSTFNKNKNIVKKYNIKKKPFLLYRYTISIDGEVWAIVRGSELDRIINGINN